MLPLLLALALAADSPRDPSRPASQDISHVEATVDPATGVWNVAVTLYGAPSADAWGNLYSAIYSGASQCADTSDLMASMQEASTLPGSSTIFGSVLPGGTLRAAEHVSKTFDGNTVDLQMTDSSLVGAAPTCLTVSISHKRLLDQLDGLPFPNAPAPLPTPVDPTPPPPPVVAFRSTHLNASRTGVVRVALKPFAQAVSGVVTLRSNGTLVGRASYRSKAGAAASVPVKLSARFRRSLARHRSLLLRITATAQAGDAVATRAVRARVRP